MSADEVKNSGTYKVKVTLENPSGTELNFQYAGAATGAASEDKTIELAGDGTKVVEITAVTGAAVNSTGVSKVTLELQDNAGHKIASSENRTFEVYNARLQDMSSFAIEDPGLKAAKNLTPIKDGNDKGFKPSVVGYYAGQKITLLNGTDFTVYTDNQSEPLFAPVPEVTDPKDFTVKKAIARVIINDDKGTAVEREFSYSFEARKVNKAEMDPTTVTAAAVALTWTSDLQGLFTIKDQYDSEMDGITPYITFSDYDENQVKVEKNGTVGAGITLKGTGEASSTLTIKLAFPGSSYVFEKVITLKR